MVRRNLVLILFAAGLVAALGYWYLVVLNVPVAADFSLTDLDGEAFRLADFRGKVVIIDFMATWCVPCGMQMQALRQVWEQYGDEIVLISIDVDPSESEDLLRRYVQQFPYATWIWARDTANVAVEYRVLAIPKIVIVDKAGIIRFQNSGVISASTLMEHVDQLLG